MKGPLGFDPRDHHYGPATAAVRHILLTWAAIDWFVPPAHGDAAMEAASALLEHQHLGHRWAPTLFPLSIEIEHASAGWPELVALCDRVRTNSAWDWKFGALKKLTQAHSKVRGWSLEQAAQDKKPKSK